jgi:hypothetical protein
LRDVLQRFAGGFDAHGCTDDAALADILCRRGKLCLGDLRQDFDVGAQPMGRCIRGGFPGNGSR